MIDVFGAGSASKIVAVFALTWLAVKILRSRGRKYPPGPKPLPIVGNLFDVPIEAPWLKLEEYTKQYGGVYWLDMPMQPTIVVGTVQAAFDLMEKRSHIYSCRQETVLDELMFWNWDFGFMKYGPKWRALRKCFHQHFSEGVVDQYRPIQTHEARAFLRRMLNGTQDIIEETSHTFSAMILDATYGMKISSMKDSFVVAARKANEGLSIAKVPGAYWVEFFPFLKHLPRWVPGTTFHKLGDHYRPFAVTMRDKPFDMVKQELAEGKVNTSVMGTLLQKAQDLEDPEKVREAEELARDSIGVAYAAGFDTSTLVSRGFILAMAMYPQVQKAAQAELDSVVGPGRLPEMSDFDSLIYIRAIVMESVRWMPVVPMGIPHVSTEDDVYNGWFIPKGTVVIANQYGMLHHEEDYPEHEVFKPERYIKDGMINPEVQDPTEMAFGFGRRSCLGRYFSMKSLFIFVATTLHVFNLQARKDEHGNLVPLVAKMVGGFLAGPESVPVSMEPRSAQAEKLIRESASDTW